MFIKYLGKNIFHEELVLTSYGLKSAKPSHEIYKLLNQTVEKTFQGKEKKIYFFDDKLDNVVAAQENGIDAYHFNKSLDKISKLEQILEKIEIKF